MSYTKKLRTSHSYIPSSYSESEPEPKEHDVFLSFRGEDTRNTFTDHLYQALVEKGISTFKDDEKIGIGKPISPELLLAIERSSMAVIVLSRNYASSTWCLQELAKIIECMKEREMRVLPIFYHVDPSDVRNQRGTFADAFAEHEIRFEQNLEKVQTWRNALREVANLSGHQLQNGRESEFIKTIVDSIFRELSDTLSIVDEDSLIGIKYPVNELLYSHLQTWRDHEVRFIGLCGMSGIGKTTVARVVFQRIRFEFQACSFLDNVSAECNVDALLEKLLSDMKLRSEKEKWDASKGRAVIKNRLRFKKVLIVLDDADKKEQLETLVGNCNWFGMGSRIIVTTKDKHLLEGHGVPMKNIYMVKGLNEYDDDLDLKLFCQGAFGKPDCGIDFLDLCKDFVHYASGHPLALKVLGSSLFGKGREVWQCARTKLKAIPNKDIQKKLQLRFDALEDTEKKLFLDIACFFNGDYKDRVTDPLEGLDCYPTIDIETLVDKSFLTSSGKRLWMHNLLQKMGWEIVRCEHRRNPGKWSRLWLSDDILQVLKENTGTDNVEGIMMKSTFSHQFKLLRQVVISHMPPHEEQLNANAFSNMKRLGLLKICNVHLPADLEYLSNELHLMEWHEYPLTSMPNNFQPHNLNLNKLKVLDLNNSQNLIKTPDFTGFSNLQRLILQGCTRLLGVHPSIGVLNRLVLLNLKDCQSLASLPYEINLESLKIVILSGCSSLVKFPEIRENMKCLSELYLDNTGIEEVPLSIQNLTGLTLLNLSGCKLDHPSELWHSLFCLSALTSLVALDLSDCNLSDGAIPGDLSGLSSLESLNLSRNNFTTLPNSICKLSKLEFLYLENCRKLQSLPSLPVSTKSVMARGCNSLESYSNQVVIWTSSGTEYTVINCLSLADNEDKVSEVSLLDVHFQPLLREPAEVSPFQPLWQELDEVYRFHHESKFYSVLPETGIPQWFCHRKCGSSVSIRLPTDLSKDSTWRGIALYIVFGVDKKLSSFSPGQRSSYIHELQYQLDMNGGLADGTIVLNVHNDQGHADSYRLCLYMSHARLGENLDLRSCICPSITTNSPSVEIKACGARILYVQDMVEFIEILSHRNFWCSNLCHWGPVPIFAQAQADMESARKPILDIDGRSVHNFCCRPRVIELAAPYSRDPSVTFDIPQNWYNDSNWMGLVLCACFSVIEHSATIGDNPDSQVPNCHLTCSLKTDVGCLDGFQIYCPTEEELMLLNRGGFEWWCYIPCGSFPDWLNHSTLIEASIAADYPNLTMKYCAFQLLYPQ